MQVNALRDRRAQLGRVLVTPRFLHRRVPAAVRYGAAFCLALSLLIVAARCYAVSFSGNADAYCVSDWLINYAGGFVRRGFGGSVILATSDLLSVRPRLLVFLILIACYAAILVMLAMIVLRRKQLTVLDLLLALSPFAALYPLVHEVAGQRKEVLLLALASFAYLTDLGRLDSVGKYIFWAAVLGALVATHDGLAFFIPLFVLYLVLLTPLVGRVGFQPFLLLVPAIVVFFLGYAYSSHTDTGAICAAIERHEDGTWCVASSVGWLNATALDGVRSVAARYSLSAGALTLLAGLVGLLPVWVALRRHSRTKGAAERALPNSRLYHGLCLAAVVPLFIVASDWSRWFYVTTSLLTLIHFAALRHTCVPETAPSAVTGATRSAG